jgi:hypothetical protein
MIGGCSDCINIRELLNKQWTNVDMIVIWLTADQGYVSISDPNARLGDERKTVRGVWKLPIATQLFRLFHDRKNLD